MAYDALVSHLARHFFACACNNAWANLRLHDALASLTDAEFGAPRVGFFPSIRETTNHILTVDWFYVDAMERALGGDAPHRDPSVFFEPECPHDVMGSLAPDQRASDHRLIALCEDLSDLDLDLDTPVTILRAGGTSVDPLSRMLPHLFQHQVHHRGQIHAMLSGTDVAPPQLDEFFSVGEAPLRAEELARLGLSEEKIWRE